MRRVVFTAEDLTRVRFAADADPDAETAYAVEVFGRRSWHAVFGPWRRSTRAVLGPRAAQVGQLFRHGAAVSGTDLSAVDGGLLRRFHAVAVAPYWHRVAAVLAAERETSGRVLARGGIEALFGVLHPGLGWKPPALLLSHQDGPDIELGGRGLVLAPTFFLRDTAVVVRDVAGEPPVLRYPVALDDVSPAALWWGGNTTGTTGTGQELSALLGRTRAAVLRAVAEVGGTGEVGRRLGLSAATVSQHTGVLRQAGLIRSRRRVNTVLHTLTPLGAALITGGEGSPADPELRAG